MPTAKPRLSITLDPPRYELLRRLAALQGVSAAHILADLLETVAPVLERTCVALENAQRASQDVRENLRRAALEAEQAILPMAGTALRQFDMFCAAVPPAAAGDALAAPGAARERPADPRPVITGVRSPPGGCTCTITEHERQENPTCPVHSVRRRRTRR